LFEAEKTMLNALPDTRNTEDMSEVFLAPNEEIDSERRDDTEIEEKVSTHENIGLGGRRKPSVSLSKSSSSSSAEVPRTNLTVDIGNLLILFLIFDISMRITTIFIFFNNS
jgi:hypothetical protein